MKVGGMTGWLKAAALAEGPDPDVEPHLPRGERAPPARDADRDWLELLDFAGAVPD